MVSVDASLAAFIGDRPRRAVVPSGRVTATAGGRAVPMTMLCVGIVVTKVSSNSAKTR